MEDGRRAAVLRSFLAGEPLSDASLRYNAGLPSKNPSMPLVLTPPEARVIGCLIEKAATTPDQYPLSLNALTNACNQKSNRDPEMSLEERSVQEILDGLVKKHLVLERSGFGSRVPKYQHRFCNTGFGSLEFTPVETAILCELLLRGPQTPGELKTRAARMTEVKDAGEVETALANLAARSDGPFVVRLPREPNRRDSRYAHLFCGEIDIPESLPLDAPEPVRTSSSLERIETLEQLVADMRRELEDLKRRIGD
jgi:uncharacterized protein YceH (UPF0502 family)